MRGSISVKLNVLAVAAVLALGLSACDSGGGDVSGPFVGTWQYTSGTVTFSCPASNQNETSTLSGLMNFAKGVDAPLVSLGEDCAFRWDVNGNTATLRPGQACADTGGDVTTTVTASGGTFTVNGTVATFSANYSYTETDGVVTVMCSIVMSGMLQRVSQ